MAAQPKARWPTTRRLSDKRPWGRRIRGQATPIAPATMPQPARRASLRTANRVVGNVTVTAGNVSNATVLASSPLASQYAGSSPSLRSAVGSDNTSNPAAVYTAGTSGTAASCGFRNFTSPGTGTQLTTLATNTRTVEMLGGYLFGSSDSGSTFVGVSVISTTGVAQTEAILVQTGASSSRTPTPRSSPCSMTGPSPTGYTHNFAQRPNVTIPYNVAYIADRGSEQRQRRHPEVGLQRDGHDVDERVHPEGRQSSGPATRDTRAWPANWTLPPAWSLCSQRTLTAPCSSRLPTPARALRLRRWPQRSFGANYVFRGVALAPPHRSRAGHPRPARHRRHDGPGSLRLAAVAEGLERENAGRELRRGRLA